jgi:hypothetical protein
MWSFMATDHACMHAAFYRICTIFLYSAESDFSSLNTSLVFLPGDTVGSPARCVNISILNDDVVEANETFDVVVSSDSILQVTGATSVPVTINEDPTDCELLILLKAIDIQNIQLLHFNLAYTCAHLIYYTMSCNPG